MCGRKSNNNFCVVCESPKAISQFGALTCRACGAFFRRLVLSNRKYDCDCEVRLRGKVETPMARKQRISKCRGCRMRRCYAAGMKEESVKTCKRSIVKLETDCSRQQTPILPEDVIGFVFIKKLLQIEEKANHILLNVIGFGNNFLDRYATFEQLIESNDSLLDHADYYKNHPLDFFDREAFEQRVARNGLFLEEPISFTKVLLISIDIAKAMPAYSRLCLMDRVTSVNGFTLASTFILSRFHSMKINAETEVMEIINYPYVLLYNKYMNFKEPVIKNLSEIVFNLPMKDFLKIAPSREEMVLLLALLYTNSSIPSLSKFGQQIMNEESEKCAKILLRFQQRQFGEQGGALRFAECLQLLWNTISTAQKYRQLIVYMDTVYEQGRFAKVMPKILAPLII